MFGASNQINVVGKEFSLSMEDWMEVKGHSQDVRPFTSSHSINNFDHERDLMIELFGEKPSPDQVLEIAKDKGLTYQRRDKEQSHNQNPPRIFNPSPSLDIDLGAWLRNAKILVPFTEAIKLPNQEAKVLDVLRASHVNVTQNETPKVSY